MLMSNLIGEVKVYAKQTLYFPLGFSILSFIYNRDLFAKNVWTAVILTVLGGIILWVLTFLVYYIFYRIRKS